MSDATTRAPDDGVAADLRGFGPLGILAIVAVFLGGNVEVGLLPVLPVGALLVLLWTWRSRTPWEDVGYRRPRNWILTIAGGIALGVGLKLMMKAVVMPLLGADPVNQSYRFLAGNRAMLPVAVWAMLVAGFSEETVFRGFLFERLRKLLGTRVRARVFIVVVTSMFFGVVHYGSQGVAGVQQATIVGLVYGTIFAVTGSIWVPMFAHAAFDLAALAMIYWNVESEIARFIFG